MKKNKEIQAAGFCVIRPDITKNGFQIQVGNILTDTKQAMPYRWLNEDEGF